MKDCCDTHRQKKKKKKTYANGSLCPFAEIKRLSSYFPSTFEKGYFLAALCSFLFSFNRCIGRSPMKISFLDVCQDKIHVDIEIEFVCSGFISFSFSIHFKFSFSI